MNGAVWSLAPAVHEEPLRRLLWVLPAAILLVLAALLVLGHWLNARVSPPPPPPPIQARIYELPPSPGAAPARAAPPSAPARPRPTPPPARARLKTAPPAPHGGVAVPQNRPHAPAPALTRPHIDWSRLHSDVNAAVAAANGASPPQIKDPNSLTARFYMASLLRKLKEVGDLNYPGEMVGMVVLDIRIDSRGRLLRVKLLSSSGKPALDHAAEKIVRMSAPFAPFPPELRHAQRKLEWVQVLSFLGNRQVDTW